MIRRMCRYPGCTRAAEEGGSFCASHKAERRPALFEGTRRAGSAEYHGLYNTARWKRLRKEFLRSHPYCALCGQPAAIADHIVPHRGDEALFFDAGNLQALCQACHSRKTLEENGHFNRR